MASESEAAFALTRENSAPAPAGNGNGGPILPDAAMEVPHRGRDVLPLVAIGVVLAALWAAIFFSGTRVWGEYHPSAAELQDPPPPPIVDLPALSLEQAREIVERAESQGASLHEPR